LTVDSTSVDWEPGTLLGSGRVRSITIERPRVELRFDPITGWNYKMDFAREKTPGVQIDEFAIKDGSFSAEWMGGGKFRVASLNGVYADLSGRGPNTFSLRGLLDSQEPLVAEGSSGP